MGPDPTAVVLASGKRLHELCSLPEWSDEFRIVGVWSPNVEERQAVAARYRAQTAEMVDAVLDLARGRWAFVGGLASAGLCLSALAHGYCVLAWPPFFAFDDLHALGRLADRAAAAGGRWRVARPTFSTLAPRATSWFGEHLPAPREALRPERTRARGATSWDLLFGRAAVALASAAPWRHRNADATKLKVHTIRAPTRLGLTVHLDGTRARRTLRMTIGEGPGLALRVPGADGADRVAPGWTLDSPSATLETVRATLMEGPDGTLGDDATVVLGWARRLAETRV